MEDRPAPRPGNVGPSIQEPRPAVAPWLHEGAAAVLLDVVQLSRPRGLPRKRPRAAACCVGASIQERPALMVASCWQG